MNGWCAPTRAPNSGDRVSPSFSATVCSRSQISSSVAAGTRTGMVRERSASNTLEMLLQTITSRQVAAVRVREPGA
jgi:hypothetical protein